MKPTKIIIHHSLTEDSGTVSWDAIRKYHVNNNGWSDIGYHFGVELIGSRVEILLGRMFDVPGAHCRTYNSDSLGICVVGNFDEKHPDLELWNKTVQLTKTLIRNFNIEDVKGHHELNPAKSCPGKYFDMDKFRRECGGVAIK